MKTFFSFVTCIFFFTSIFGSTIFHNTASAPDVQTCFNHIRIDSTEPIFTVSSTSFAGYNSIEIELNTKPDFTGVSYVQVFTGSYGSGIKYDLHCNSLNPNLPTNEATYFVSKSESLK
jgi:hypothetical protein